MADRRALILADDFTGAGDAAAPFAVAQQVLVVLSAAASGSAWDVLSVDLDVRECGDAQAQAKTDQVARQLCSAAAEMRVFLKIDSTLRGPIAGLVAGALSGSGRSIAVIAPAFPEQGRFVSEGRVVVNGEPGASLTALLGMRGTAVLGARFASSAAEVARGVEHARMRGAQRVVVDTDSAACLESLAAAWRLHTDWLLVGSGGLARRVAARTSAEHAPNFRPASGPVLVVAGSPTPMTAAQIDRLRGVGSIVTVRPLAPPARLPPPPHGVLVVCTPPATERDAGESARAIADTIGEWSSSLLPAVVVLAGGATARAVCERLGASGVQVLGELSPGVPVGRLVGGVWDATLVVTKAGGFGTPTTLLDVVRSVGVLSSSP